MEGLFIFMVAIGVIVFFVMRNDKAKKEKERMFLEQQEWQQRQQQANEEAQRQARYQQQQFQQWQEAQAQQQVQYNVQVIPMLSQDVLQLKQAMEEVQKNLYSLHQWAQQLHTALEDQRGQAKDAPALFAEDGTLSQELQQAISAQVEAKAADGEQQLKVTQALFEALNERVEQCGTTLEQLQQEREKVEQRSQSLAQEMAAHKEEVQRKLAAFSLIVANTPVDNGDSNDATATFDATFTPDSAAEVSHSSSILASTEGEDAATPSDALEQQEEVAVRDATPETYVRPRRIRGATFRAKD